MRGNEAAARGAGLPLAGSTSGWITLVQETRFRLVDEKGRGYLFTLGWEAGVSARDLAMWSREGVQVRVGYQGAPDLGAVAVSIRRRWPLS